MHLLIGQFVLRKPHLSITNICPPSRLSFYSSQGRQTSFPDYNAGLIEHLQSSINDLATLEVFGLKDTSLALAFGCEGTDTELLLDGDLPHLSPCCLLAG
jgi:hypothetical protein